MVSGRHCRTTSASPSKGGGQGLFINSKLTATRSCRTWKLAFHFYSPLARCRPTQSLRQSALCSAAAETVAPAFAADAPPPLLRVLLQLMLLLRSNLLIYN